MAKAAPRHMTVMRGAGCARSTSTLAGCCSLRGQPCSNGGVWQLACVGCGNSFHRGGRWPCRKRLSMEKKCCSRSPACTLTRLSHPRLSAPCSDASPLRWLPTTTSEARHRPRLSRCSLSHLPPRSPSPPPPLPPPPPPPPPSPPPSLPSLVGRTCVEPSTACCAPRGRSAKLLAYVKLRISASRHAASDAGGAVAAQRPHPRNEVASGAEAAGIAPEADGGARASDGASSGTTERQWANSGRSRSSCVRCRQHGARSSSASSALAERPVWWRLRAVDSVARLSAAASRAADHVPTRSASTAASTTSLSDPAPPSSPHRTSCVPRASYSASGSSALGFVTSSSLSSHSSQRGGGRASCSASRRPNWLAAAVSFPVASAAADARPSLSSPVIHRRQPRRCASCSFVWAAFVAK